MSKVRPELESVRFALDSVRVRVAESAKDSVEPPFAVRLLIPEERAFAPLKASVPPAVEAMLPVFVLLPESVMGAVLRWVILPPPLMLEVTVLADDWLSRSVVPLAMARLPLPKEPLAPASSSVPAFRFVPPE